MASCPLAAQDWIVFFDLVANRKATENPFLCQVKSGLSFYCALQVNIAPQKVKGTFEAAVRKLHVGSEQRPTEAFDFLVSQRWYSTWSGQWPSAAEFLTTGELLSQNLECQTSFLKHLETTMHSLAFPNPHCLHRAGDGRKW